ncbi:hypothetical protein [Wolbachia endosymbiont (group A) of Nomada goodeniana]
MNLVPIKSFKDTYFWCRLPKKHEPKYDIVRPAPYSNKRKTRIGTVSDTERKGSPFEVSEGRMEKEKKQKVAKNFIKEGQVLLKIS